MNVLEAADLVRTVYYEKNASRIRHQIDVKGVQAAFLEGEILVIPGTNEFSDWFRFNFDVYDLFGGESEGFEVSRGDSGARWHAGFLEHAQTVYAFAKPLRPKYIFGHSLGAASAQIVGSSLRAPTIGFASPKTNRGSNRLRGEEFVLDLCRTDDTVCHVPMNFLGFRHVGTTIWMNPDGINVGEDHRIDEYLELMTSDRIAALLPSAWPRSALA